MRQLVLAYGAEYNERTVDGLLRGVHDICCPFNMQARESKSLGLRMIFANKCEAASESDRIRTIMMSGRTPGTTLSVPPGRP